jgi:RNA polymerase sigma-70 factor (ECF subfamily)
VPSEPHKLRLIVGQGEEAPSAPNPKPTLDDIQLLAALRAGDASAATALHDRTRPIVQRTVRRLLGFGDSDAQDLCQLAFIELVKTIDRFRGDCPLDAWVSVVSARIVYKHLRRRKLERRLFTSTPLQLVLDVPTAQRHGSVLRDLLRRVSEHLTHIDEKRALAFLLHDAYGYDLKEIAHITGVSVAAAQSRLKRGRREVHERIAEDPGLARALDDLHGPGEP